jgi:2',3'-cyclic-nucleotide 2'-phosphodiesterase (5'-nucleotidase family)
MAKKITILLSLLVIISLVLPIMPTNAAAPITFTILHTNDFHGQLLDSNADPTKASNPGYARVANVINMIRTAKGAANVLLVDSGDEMQGSLLSNLGDGTATGKGLPTIATFNAIGYNVATFGNHEFDWGQVNLAARTTQATYPFVTANIVKNDTGDCSTAGWTKPDFANAPYVVQTVGTAPNTAKVAFIGVTTTETPTITIASATAGLCFKDPADSILHYYNAMKAAADVIVVLSHLGYTDGGYGYGIPVYGDQTLAGKLNTAGKPVNLIIGGHSHTNLTPPATMVGKTSIVQAYYNGRVVGDAEISIAGDGTVTTNWKTISWKIPTAPATTPFGWKLTEVVGGTPTVSDFADATKDPTVDTLITGFATNPAYLAIVNQPIGYSAVNLPRSGGIVDNMMGTFVDDAIYNYLNTDGEPANDIDMFFNNAGGIRTDWCYSGGAWVSSGCTEGTHTPALLTYGNMFTILPFGNATVVGQMTGAQILDVLNYAPNVTNGVIQPAGIKFKYYSYKDLKPGPQPFAWGAFDVTVYNKTTHVWEPLDLKKTYKVGTNEFLAPAGGDGYSGFKYMTGITYWGDMLNAVDAYVTASYGTAETAYNGPKGDGTLDGRIIRDGTDTPNSGTIIPITILHHNDSHGNLEKGAYVGYTQLATLIKQELAHNTRNMLLNGGDAIQGDAMMYYFRTAGLGYASDGTPLPAALQINPMVAAMNALPYDAFDLGNHEFNFGKDVFVATFKKANMPILGANVSDSGAYGLAQIPVKPYIEKSFQGATADPSDLIDVGVLGITNHRVPNYELPSNIPGLTFSNPIDTANLLVPTLKAKDDAVVALTHIGFTTNPSSVEVDNNVDTVMAAQVAGIDAIIGAHSHTNPASPEAPYKYLPTIIGGPNNTPVMVNQAYRYNNTLGEVVLGMRPKVGGGYEVAARAGRYLTVQMSTVEDPTVKAIIDPYDALLTTYKNTPLGVTTTPIDALSAFTQETNGANLQADASVFELAQHGINVDFHISGAMTNKKIASTATPSSPVSLVNNDMFTLMPYENSLVVFALNGPQLKTILERGYRNYYYYKYVPGYGGYSYYTTCMIDINHNGQIKYREGFPNGKNVISLKFDGGKQVDFNDPLTFYEVSTVNYIAAGSCNFNNNGVTLWPLNQITHDTQYYVRDAVIDYVRALGTVGPTIEGRLSFAWYNWLPLVGN